MSSTYAFFKIASAALGFSSSFIFAVYYIAIIAIVGARRSPNVRTVLT